jgi:isopentenyl phosphate kinase
MSTATGVRIESGDVVELDLGGEARTALVLLATDDGAIFDFCDGSLPVVLQAHELAAVRVFDHALAA